MKLLRYFLPCFALAFLTLPLLAAPDNLGPNAQGYQSEGQMGPEDEDDIDPKMLRKFIEDQGLIESRNKEGRLTISGDARARWTHTLETVNGVNQRGFNLPPQVAENIFKSEINLFFEYTTPYSWVETKLKFANFDGKDGGTATKVEMDRAFIGYEIFEDKDTELYIEVGRNRMDVLFDSKVEFTSTFDGILLTFRESFPELGDFDIHGGPMIVDSYTSHYAWIFETSLRNIYDTGFSVKYSLVDWKRGATTLYYGNLSSEKVKPITPTPLDPQLRNNPRYRFVVSQILVGYEFDPNPFVFCRSSWFYAAGLINTAARPIRQTNYKKENIAWYVGYTIGKLKRRCDWSIDINYQYVQMQAVPEFDLAGIGHGNASDTLFSDCIIQGLAPGSCGGFTNYQGLEITGLYALTDSLSLKLKYQHTSPIDKSIGGRFMYDNWELSGVFAF